MRKEKNAFSNENGYVQTVEHKQKKKDGLTQQQHKQNL